MGSFASINPKLKILLTLFLGRKVDFRKLFKRWVVRRLPSKLKGFRLKRGWDYQERKKSFFEWKGF